MKEISTKEFAELIVELIQEEPYFTKDILVPKIKTLATVFRLKLSTTNYNAIKSPSQVAKLIRGHEIMDNENSYWKEQLCNIVGKEKMQPYYEKLDKRRKSLDTKKDSDAFNEVVKRIPPLSFNASDISKFKDNLYPNKKAIK